MNRMAHGDRKHDYDIVVGPVADDGVVFQLNLYMQRLITMETLIKELTFSHLNNQYFFGTECAIQQLPLLVCLQNWLLQMRLWGLPTHKAASRVPLALVTSGSAATVFISIIAFGIEAVWYRSAV